MSNCLVTVNGDFLEVHCWHCIDGRAEEPQVLSKEEVVEGATPAIPDDSVCWEMDFFMNFESFSNLKEQDRRGSWKLAKEIMVCFQFVV